MPNFAGYDTRQLMRVAIWMDRANLSRFNEKIPDEEMDDFFALFFVKDTIAVKEVLTRARIEMAKKSVQDATEALAKLERGADPVGLGK